MTIQQMRCVYAQEFNKNVPFHVTALEGTKTFPVYLLGYTKPNYDGLYPLYIETYAFIADNNDKYVSLFSHALRHPRYNKRYYSLFFPSLIEDSSSYALLFRKCKFVMEEEVEKDYSNMTKPIRAAFNMYWKVC